MNIYLFLAPAFILILGNRIHLETTFSASTLTHQKQRDASVSSMQWGGIVTLCLIALFFLYLLIRFWRADVAYALGYNYNRVNEYQRAFFLLKNAVNLRTAEPVFKDELSVNAGTLATALLQQNDATQGAQLAQEAINLSDELVEKYPNNVVFWKSRVKLFYTLAQVNPQYFAQALQSIEKAHTLAPTDAKITYNLGVLYGQNGDVTRGIQVLEVAVKMKPDYSDAYYALGLFYRDLATGGSETVKDQAMQEKGNMILKEYLTRHPDDKRIQDLLQSWGAL